MIEPQIGEIITVKGVKYKTKLAVNPDEQCDECCLCDKPCLHINCTSFVRRDSKAVIFKEIEEMEVKIQIPDNCELIKDGNTYIVKEKEEKKQIPPKSWEEFCDNNDVQKQEHYIDSESKVCRLTDKPMKREYTRDKNLCTTAEEADAFLALMQLRQLRKAWVGDWEQSKENSCAGIFYSISQDEVTVSCAKFWINITLSFPTRGMAEEFLYCFKDLCEIAKILL